MDFSGPSIFIETKTELISILEVVEDSKGLLTNAGEGVEQGGFAAVGVAPKGHGQGVRSGSPCRIGVIFAAGHELDIPSV